MLQITTNEESPSIKIVIDGKISNLFPKNSLVITGTEEGLEFRSAYDIKNVWFKGEWNRGIKLNDTDITIENYETELSSLFFLSKAGDGETITNVYDNSSLRVWLSPQSEIPDEQEDGIIYIGYEDQ